MPPEAAVKAKAKVEAKAKAKLAATKFKDSVLTGKIAKAPSAKGAAVRRPRRVGAPGGAPAAELVEDPFPEHPLVRSVIFRGATVEIRRGNILTILVNVIVNAANVRLRGGGGINGAIQTAAGPALLAELRELYPNGGETGIVYPTGSHNMETTDAIYHVPSPDYRLATNAALRGQAAVQLSNSYRAILTQMMIDGATTVAIPAISVGIFAYPRDEAAGIAMNSVHATINAQPPGTFQRIVFLAFSEPDADSLAVAFDAQFGSLVPEVSGEPSHPAGSPVPERSPPRSPGANTSGSGGRSPIPSSGNPSPLEGTAPPPVGSVSPSASGSHSSPAASHVSPSGSASIHPAGSPIRSEDPNDIIQCSGLTRAGLRCRRTQREILGPRCRQHRE